MSSIVELMSRIPPPFNMVVVIVLICSVCGVITSIAKQVRKFACHRQELNFKREMLDRGMPAEEIELVLRANRPDSSTA